MFCVESGTTSVSLNTIVTTTVPAQKEYEMYNLKDDPYEMNNLMFNPTEETLKIAYHLRKILRNEIKKKLIFTQKEYIYDTVADNIKAP